MQLLIPQSLGGDAWGDVPLQSDGSLRLTVPAGELLLVQGIDAQGHVVSQHSRVFTMPPGQRVDTSVKRTQYHAQCASCHGVIEGGLDFPSLTSFDMLAAEMDFETVAMASAPVDLTASGVERRALTYMHALRPILEQDLGGGDSCIGCHSGAMPAGDFYYLTSYPYQSHLGRGGRYSDTSYLLEVLTGQDFDARKAYAGVDHTGYLSEAEVRTLMSVIDMGFPYMSRCDDKLVPSGPNAGQPWGDPSETDLP